MPDTQGQSGQGEQDQAPGETEAQRRQREGYEAIKRMTPEEVYRLYDGRFPKNWKVDQLTGVLYEAVINLPEITDKLRGMSNWATWSKNIEGILRARGLHNLIDMNISRPNPLLCEQHSISNWKAGEKDIELINLPEVADKLRGISNWTTWSKNIECILRARGLHNMIDINISRPNPLLYKPEVIVRWAFLSGGIAGWISEFNISAICPCGQVG